MHNQEEKSLLRRSTILSALTALTVDELDERVNGKLIAALKNLGQEHEGEFSFDLAWKAVGTNLRAGQARIVVVLDQAHDGLERIFHFLARNSKLDVQLFTVQRYKSNGDEVFVPRILVNPASEDDSAAASAKHQKSL
jgi:hypothetical protein